MFFLGHVGLALLGAEGPRALRGRFDVRLLALGALLPDLLDKGLLLSLGSGTGKALGHALVFTLLLLALSAYRPIRAAAGALAFGTGSHLLLDRMWVEWDALTWPLSGMAFASYPFDPSRALVSLLTDPETIVGEILGGAALVWLAVRHRPKGLRRALRTGRFSDEGPGASSEAPK